MREAPAPENRRTPREAVPGFLVRTVNFLHLARKRLTPSLRLNRGQGYCQSFELAELLDSERRAEPTDTEETRMSLYH